MNNECTEYEKIALTEDIQEIIETIMKVVYKKFKNDSRANYKAYTIFSSLLVSHLVNTIPKDRIKDIIKAVHAGHQILIDSYVEGDEGMLKPFKIKKSL